MTEVIILLFVFAALGLARQRLGRLAYTVMGLTILVYVFYAFNK